MPMELVQKQNGSALPGWHWQLGACGEPRTVIRGDVSTGLFGKHGVNLAQNLGVWFGGQSQSSKKGGDCQSIFKSFKTERQRRTFSKIRKINSWKNTVKSRNRWPLTTSELLAHCRASWAWLAQPLWDEVAPAGWHEI